MRPPSTAYTRTFKVGGKCKNGFALSNKPYIIADEPGRQEKNGRLPY